jgi:hypothetical protein
MSGFKISLSGLQSTINKLQQTADDIAFEVDAEIGGRVVDMSKMAARLAPKFNGDLARTISPKQIKPLEWELVAQSEYAAYMEFGTKGYAKIPAGLEEYASKFRGKGRGSYNELVDNLTNWVRKKGIAATEIKYSKDGKLKKAGSLKQGIMERQLARFLAFIIMTKGIKPQPFFFPSVYTYRPQIVKNVIKILREKRK